MSAKASIKTPNPSRIHLDYKNMNHYVFPTIYAFPPFYTYLAIDDPENSPTKKHGLSNASSGPISSDRMPSTKYKLKQVQQTQYLKIQTSTEL